MHHGKHKNERLGGQRTSYLNTKRQPTDWFQLFYLQNFAEFHRLPSLQNQNNRTMGSLEYVWGMAKLKEPRSGQHTGSTTQQPTDWFQLFYLKILVGVHRLPSWQNQINQTTGSLEHVRSMANNKIATWRPTCWSDTKWQPTDRFQLFYLKNLVGVHRLPSWQNQINQTTGSLEHVRSMANNKIATWRPTCWSDTKWQPTDRFQLFYLKNLVGVHRLPSWQNQINQTAGSLEHVWGMANNKREPLGSQCPGCSHKTTTNRTDWFYPFFLH